jgi:carbon storage regulator
LALPARQKAGVHACRHWRAGRTVRVLVLSRKVGQVITIGDDTTVTVLEVRGTKVRLGVAAPVNFAVDRQEVHDRRPTEPRQAPRAR